MNVGKLDLFFNQETLAAVLDIFIMEELLHKAEIYNKKKAKDKILQGGKALNLLREENLSSSQSSFSKHHSMQDIHEQLGKIKSSLRKTYNVLFTLDSFDLTFHDLERKFVKLQLLEVRLILLQMKI